MTFGQRLKYLREKQSIARTELADKLGMSYWALSKYETDERFPDKDSLNKIADFFDVTTDYLLGRTNTPNITTEAAHRTDDPMDDLPEEAKKSIEEFKQYIYNKYSKK